jgi:catalase
MQMEIKTSRVNYSPNSLGNNRPTPVSEEEGEFVHFPERLEGHKVRERSPSFADHFSQATLFWNSLSTIEKDHLIEAAHFELGKAKDKKVQQHMVDRFNQVDHELAKRVAQGLGMPTPPEPETPNHGKQSAALSQEHTTKTAKGRKVAILAADGVDSAQLMALKQALSEMDVATEVVSRFGGTIKGTEDQKIEVDQTFSTTASVLFDAIYVPGGTQSIEALKMHEEALYFIDEAFRHYKPIAASGEGLDLLMQSNLKGIDLSQANGKMRTELGVVANRNVSEMEAFSKAFLEAIKEHRHWMRFAQGSALRS